MNLLVSAALLAYTLLVNKLSKLCYQITFIAYDLAIVSIAFFLRRPRLRKLMLKLFRKKLHLSQAQLDCDDVNAAVEEWINTVDQLYYVTHVGWGDGRWGKTPVAQRSATDGAVGDASEEESSTLCDQQGGTQ